MHRVEVDPRALLRGDNARGRREVGEVAGEQLRRRVVGADVGRGGRLLREGIEIGKS